MSIQTTSPQAAVSGSRLPELAILALAAAVLLYGLGVRSLNRQEGRWAEISREMMLTGDYFHPAIGGEPYDDKPVVGYWLVAFAGKLTGHLDESDVRLPSAIGGLVIIACTLWIGRRLWTPPVARMAAVVLLTSFGFLFWSRVGMVEMGNAAVVMLAICWYWARRERPGFGSYLVFYLIVFIGALVKGLPALVLPLIAILPDLLIEQRWRKSLTRSHLLAIAIGIALYLAPFAYAALSRTNALQASSLSLVFRENIRRFFIPFDHDQEPLYLYFYFLPYLLLPWAPLFVASVAGFIAGRRELSANSRWLGLAFAALFVFFTIGGSRRGYYIVPLLPFAALMIGVFMLELREPGIIRLRRAAIVIQGVGVALTVLVALMGPIIARPFAARSQMTLTNDINRSMWLLGLTALVLGGAVYWVARRACWELRWFRAIAAASLVLIAGFVCYQQNLLEIYRTERPFLRDVRKRVEGIEPENIAFYRTDSAALHFYLGKDRPPPLVGSRMQLDQFMARPGPHAVITLRRFADDACGAFPPTDRAPHVSQQAAPWARDSDEDDLVAWVFKPPAAAR